MRRYKLASREAKYLVNLKEYSTLILTVVHEIMPQAVVTVEVHSYTVHPTPNRSEAIRIGRKLSKVNALGRHCISIPKLFNSTEVSYGKEKRNG